MQRIIPLILALLLLAACGAETVEAATETAVTTPTVAPMPEASSLPDYIPPMDFEPVSVWQAERFCGRALLYLGAEEDGSTPFKVYSCFTYEVVDYLDGNMLMSSRAFSAKAVDSGDFSVDCSKHGRWLEPVLGTSELTGKLSVDGDRLTLEYTGHERATWAKDTPGFECRLSGGQPVIDSGTGENDSVQYLPTEFKRLPDEYLGRAMYWMPMFEEEASAGQLRGLGVGDSYADIVARFPTPLDIWSRDPRSVSAPDGWYDTFYGSEAGTVFAALYYEGGVPSTVLITCSFYASFRLDEGLNITEVSVVTR